MTNDNQQRQTERPTVTLNVDGVVVNTSPERAQQYFQQLQVARYLEQTEMTMRRQHEIDVLSKKLIPNNYPELRGVVFGLAANLGLVAGIVCMAGGVIYANVETFRDGLEMAIPGAAYLIGRTDGVRSVKRITR